MFETQQVFTIFYVDFTKIVGRPLSNWVNYWLCSHSGLLSLAIHLWTSAMYIGQSSEAEK